MRRDEKQDFIIDWFISKIANTLYIEKSAGYEKMLYRLLVVFEEEVWDLDDYSLDLLFKYKGGKDEN